LGEYALLPGEKSGFFWENGFGPMFNDEKNRRFFRRKNHEGFNRWYTYGKFTLGN